MPSGNAGAGPQPGGWRGFRDQGLQAAVLAAAAGIAALQQHRVMADLTRAHIAAAKHLALADEPGPHPNPAVDEYQRFQAAADPKIGLTQRHAAHIVIHHHRHAQFDERISFTGTLRQFRFGAITFTPETKSTKPDKPTPTPRILAGSTPLASISVRMTATI
jgi:hypothetical protein